MTGGGDGGPPREVPGPLLEVLEDARTLGFLGPGPVAPQVDHAVAYCALLELDDAAPGPLGPFLDLGSGGGVPGLVLATLLSGTRWVLLDSMVRRTGFLDQAVERLRLGSRVRVVTARAEEVGRDQAHRMRYRAIVARSFAAPPVLAECAAPLLMRGGTVVVSEPPVQSGVTGPRPGRWPAAGLAQLGLAVDWWAAGPPSLVRLRQTGRCPRTYPRAVGVPGRNPLW